MTSFLDDYLSRIGLPERPPAPDLAGLARIVAAHLGAIPFENLDPFTGRDVPLDPASLAAKLVHGGRGGYCYEHNLLLRRVLTELGYTVTGLIARVRLGRPADAPPTGRSHMLLRVDLPQGPHVVDVGFGGSTISAPLAITPDVEQDTPHGPYRLRTEADVLVLEAQTAGQWRWLYAFDLTPAADADYELANFYTSRHPTSGFVTGLAGARTVPGARLALGGTRFSVHHVDGPSEQTELTSPREVRDRLERDLLIDTSALPDLDEHLARLF